MPSWKTLDQNTMKSWEKRLEAIETASPQEQQKLVGQYYQDLIEHNHIYGNLAYQASQNKKFAGRLANKYLGKMAAKEKIKLTNELRQQIMVKLALRDVHERIENHGNAIAPKIIHDYHIDILDKVAGLSKHAWTGTIFEHVAPGVFMLGQGPTDQNGGKFAVEKILLFSNQAAETGGLVHRETANFLGTILTDGVVMETVRELPDGEVRSFMGDVWNGLEGNKLELLTCPNAYKIIAQQCIRQNYHDLFQALENDTSTFENMKQRSFFELAADESVMDKDLFRAAISQPNVKLHFLNAYNQLISKAVGGIDIAQEAHVEYERVYNKPMPESYQQFISKDLKFSLSQLPSINNSTHSQPSEPRGFFGTLFSWFSSDSAPQTNAPSARAELPSLNTHLDLDHTRRTNWLLSDSGTSTTHRPDAFFSSSGFSPSSGYRNDPIGESFNIAIVQNRHIPSGIERAIDPLFAPHRERIDRMSLGNNDRNSPFNFGSRY